MHGKAPSVVADAVPFVEQLAKVCLASSCVVQLRSQAIAEFGGMMDFQEFYSGMSSLGVGDESGSACVVGSVRCV